MIVNTNMKDYRLQFYSYGKNSFLQVVKENKRLIDFYLNEWTQSKKQPNNTQGDPMSTKSDNHTGCIRPETLRGSFNHGKVKA